MLTDDSEDNTREGHVFSVLSDRHKSLISLLFYQSLTHKSVLCSVESALLGFWKALYQSRGLALRVAWHCMARRCLLAEPVARRAQELLSDAAALRRSQRSPARPEQLPLPLSSARDPPRRVRYSAATASTSAARSPSITRFHGAAQSNSVQSNSDSLLSAVTRI